jgi:two-component system, LytTR family, sensor histidine kinase AlgZ
VTPRGIVPRMPASGEVLRLPRELGWLYLIAPWLTAPLLVRDLFARTWTGALREVGATYIPFVAIPLGCHALYQTAVPAWIARLRHRPLRFAAHAAVTTVVAIVVGAAIWPVHAAACARRETTLAGFLVVSVIITWAFVLPALLVQELRARAEATERAERAQRQLALEAQLAALQARTNPHFFFNSINTVASLIPEDPELAERTLERIADIVRYALDTSPAREVALGRELAIVRDYLEVSAARFGARLRWSVDLDPAAADARVPPLIVQPLVENAVLHGVANRPEGGEVWVRARRAGDVIRIEVQDDGPGPAGSGHEGTRTSLADLTTRLALLYGGEGRLTTGRGPRGGYHVCLELPLRERAP